MLESHDMDRAKFPTSAQQRKWFEELLTRTSVSEVAFHCSCSERTVRDWRRAKFTPPYKYVGSLCAQYGVPLPTVERIAPYQHTRRAGRIGGAATVQRYRGLHINEDKRLRAWRQWWNEHGSKKSNTITIALPIRVPEQSVALAEFIGIMLGDGTVGPYHISVTLHAKDDSEYAKFVEQLIERLFGVTPKRYPRRNKQAVAITVARKSLVDLLCSYGFKVGSKIKNKTQVPAWILRNRKYRTACLRGLLDTDGTVFNHRYRVKQKVYTYKKISFSSASPILRNNVMDLLQYHGITAQRSGTNVRINSQDSVKRYVASVGFSNTKHLKRFKE